nr:MAG TPA: hypothetical protein [Inoviridae sp.]
MNKIGKRFLCSMIALVCMLSASLPVYAGGGGTVRGDEVLALSYYDYSTDSKGNVEKTYFRELYAIGGGNMYPLVVVDSNFSKGGLIVGICDSSAGQYGVKNQSTNLKTSTVTEGTTPSGSSISALAYFKKMSGVYDKKDCTWYQYLINSGISKDDIEKYLSEVNMCLGYSIGMRDWNDTNREITVATSKFNVMELYYYIVSLYQKEKPWEKDPNEDWTLPKFYLKTHNDSGMNKYTEYTLTWDTRESFVENKESEYGFKVYIGTDNKPLNARILDSTNLSPCLFTEKSFVFTWQDVKDLFSVLNTSKLENRFDIFIQITHKDGSTIRALSNEYIHYLIVKRVEIRENNIVDKNGNEKSTYGKWENGQFKYTDGRDTSSEDNSTNSNGSSTAPGSNVSNDDYTDVSNAPSSSHIDASATSSLIKTLDTIVSSVSNVPALLAKVYAWLPYQIITLIGTAIGLIVVVGIIKWVL